MIDRGAPGRSGGFDVSVDPSSPRHPSRHLFDDAGGAALSVADETNGLAGDPRGALAARRVVHVLAYQRLPAPAACRAVAVAAARPLGTEPTWHQRGPFRSLDRLDVATG